MRALTIVIIIVLFTNCGVYLRKPQVGNNALWKTIQYNDSAEFCLLSQRLSIDSVINRHDGKVYHANDKCFKLAATELNAGINDVSLIFYLSNGTKRRKSERFYMVSDVIPMQYSVQNYTTICHDTSAYTQGLIYHDDCLYESTGLRGKSSLRTIDPQNGVTLNTYLLKDSIFGEGITFYNSEIKMLTWKDSLSLCFNEDLHFLGQHVYPREGWGLTTVNDKLLASDGSDRLYYLSDDLNQIDSSFQVFNHRGAVYYLNELENVYGDIWANILGKDTIMVIDTDNGHVKAEIDVTHCIDRLRYPEAGALNGIAFDQANRIIYLTGKNWPFILIWQPLFFEKQNN